MQVLVDDGVRIDARIEGSGEDAIVLLHGFPLTKDIWSAQIPELAKRHRVIALDARGMGGSTGVDGPQLMSTLAGDVAGVLDHLGVARATLVGHSLGGYIALAFARMYAERVARLALVCSRIAADTPERARARIDSALRLERTGVDASFVEQNMASQFAPKTLEKSPKIGDAWRESLGKNDARMLAGILRGMALRDTAEDIAPDLDMPVLVVAGCQDSIVPLEESKQMAAAFPHGRFAPLSESGHLPMLEEPATLTRVLAEFTGG